MEYKITTLEESMCIRTQWSNTYSMEHGTLIIYSVIVAYLYLIALIANTDEA